MPQTPTRALALALSSAAACWALSCSANSTSTPTETADSAATADGSLAGRLDGREITVAELDEWIRNDLFERESQDSPAKLYELRTDALENMMNEMIVAKRAKAEGLSEEALMERETKALGPISDEEVEAFYEKNKSRLQRRGDLATLGPQIRQFLEQEQPKEVIAKLREGAEIEVALDPPRIQVATTGPSRGPDDAPITIVEFSDYQCPFCGRSEPVMEEVLKRYPDKVRLVYRHLPLSFHKNARPAAEASICAEDQGRFWEYHALLFQNQKALASEDLQKYASQVGLDVDAFNACLEEEPTGARVDRDLREARAAGASGTPAFFVNGIPLSGALPAEEFVEVIDEELARLEAGGSAS